MLSSKYSVAQTTRCLTERRHGQDSRRRRRLEPRNRRPYGAEPRTARRSGHGVHRRAPRFGGDRRRRRHLRTSHRRVGEGRVRGSDPRRRARHPTRRCHRSRRCVRAADRRQGVGDGALERLLPGVPRDLRLAVRRRAPHRRQAGAQRGLGVRDAGPGAGSDQSAGHARRPDRQGDATGRGVQPGNGGRRSLVGSVDRSATVRSQARPRAKKSSGRAAAAAPADSAAVATTPPSSAKKGRRRRGGSTALGADQRAGAVPGIRRSPPGGLGGERHRRSVLVPWGLCRRRWRPLLHPAQEHGRSATGKGTRGAVAGGGTSVRGDVVRLAAPRHRRRPR